MENVWESRMKSCLGGGGRLSNVLFRAYLPFPRVLYSSLVVKATAGELKIQQIALKYTLTVALGQFASERSLMLAQP